MPRIKKATTVQEEPVLENTQKEEVKKEPTKIRAKKAVSKFDIFADESILQQEKELLAKAGVRGAFKSASDINREYLPVPWFALQYALG